MKKAIYWIIISIVAAVVVAMILIGYFREKMPEDVLVRVDDAVITADDFRKEWRSHHSAPAGLLPESVDNFLEDMIAEKLFLSEAHRRKIDRGDRFRLEIEKYREQLMVEALLNEEVLAVRPPSQAEIKEYWARKKKFFAIPELTRVSHILIKPGDGEDKDEVLVRCQKILGRLEEGEDFSALAQEVSEADSAVRGGDLGYFRPGQLSPELESRVRELEVDKVSGPIETEYGYHIIIVKDRKPPRERMLAEAYDEVIEAMLAQMRRGKFNAFKSQLEARSFIWKNEEMLNRLRAELERQPQ